MLIGLMDLDLMDPDLTDVDLMDPDLMAVDLKGRGFSRAGPHAKSRGFSP
jgi:hypothetical protein